MPIKVFPVVHVKEVGQAVDQSSLALESGADGVYLIDHITGSPLHLFDTYDAVREANLNAFIGLNLLGYTSLNATAELEGVDLYPPANGLWVDDANPDHDLTEATRSANPHLKKTLYLGGVAFKYTPGYTDSAAEAAAEASRLALFVDVVVTSGPRTGKAPSVKKIKAMKEAIGDQELAVASGVTTKNLTDYSAADQVLVSSSIETYPSSGVFNLDELRKLIETAHEL